MVFIRLCVCASGIYCYPQLRHVWCGKTSTLSTEFINWNAHRMKVGNCDWSTAHTTHKSLRETFFVVDWFGVIGPHIHSSATTSRGNVHSHHMNRSVSVYLNMNSIWLWRMKSIEWGVCVCICVCVSQALLDKQTVLCCDTHTFDGVRTHAEHMILNTYLSRTSSASELAALLSHRWDALAMSRHVQDFI